MTLTDLLHYLRLGGVTMAILLVASLLALGVAIERIIALWGVSESSRALSDAIAKFLLRGDVAGARSAAERSDSAMADIYLAGFSRLDRSKNGAGIESAVQRERMQTTLRLKKNLWILGTIGATTPFVGLFGTVAGIMRSFRELGVDVAQGGSGGPGSVMMGISEALIATAVGIVVAVQAVVFYNYFQARLGRVNVELALLTDEFVELVKEGPAAGTSSSTPSSEPAVATRPAEGAV